jgi:hypothetical protein
MHPALFFSDGFMKGRCFSEQYRLGEARNGGQFAAPLVCKDRSEDLEFGSKSGHFHSP